MNRSMMVVFLVFAVLIGSAPMVAAQPSDPWNMAYETPIAKTVAEVRGLLLPFGQQAGFPDVRPAGLETASFEKLYKTAAEASRKGSQAFNDLVTRNKFPLRWALGARYFQKRLEIASHEYPAMAGNEKVYEFLCRDFAAAADKGFEELRYWGLAEGLIFDNIWFKAIQAAFVPVKEKMALAVVPTEIPPDQARTIWRQAASALVIAGNEAGIASTKVGSMGFAAFPAWRLKFGIKYFKAAAKAAVVGTWESRTTDPKFWMTACEKLRMDIEGLQQEMDSFLKLMQ